MSLKDKTLFITGASRGIGLAIALRAARDGANIVIAAKTSEPHPKLPGTIYSAAKAVEEAGGHALPVIVDVRHEASVEQAVDAAVKRFGGIDIVVNNASAIDLSSTERIALNRFDLIQQINVRGTFVVSRACIPHLSRSANPHVLALSPPLELRSDWFAAHLPYTLSKYGMSMCMFGMAAEYREAGIAFNTLWPRTTIATAAVEFALGGREMMARSRKPEIMADAAYAIFNKPAREFSGRACIDDSVLYDEGVRSFEHYSVGVGKGLQVDIFVDPKAPAPPGVELDDGGAK